MRTIFNRLCLVLFSGSKMYLLHEMEYLVFESVNLEISNSQYEELPLHFLDRLC